MTEDTEPKRGPGRPPEFVMPERIDATPEEIDREVPQTKPTKRWRYTEDAKRKECGNVRTL